MCRKIWCDRYWSTFWVHFLKLNGLLARMFELQSLRSLSAAGWGWGAGSSSPSDLSIWYRMGPPSARTCMARPRPRPGVFGWPLKRWTRGPLQHHDLQREGTLTQRQSWRATVGRCRCCQEDDWHTEWVLDDDDTVAYAPWRWCLYSHFRLPSYTDEQRLSLSFF
jgi:hypothetical protein